jgi:AAA domain (dynein-related subfamily)/CbbQ/NirQ/NorQ C-terminal
MNRSQKKEMFINALVLTGKDQVTKSEITEICEKIDIAHPYWFTNDEKNKVTRGVYKVPTIGSTPSPAIEMAAQVLPMTKPVEKSDNRIQNVQTDLESSDLIPKSYKNYVPFGNFEDVLSIVNSHRFFPVFVTGHSGNGKTMSIEQACAKSKRKFVCVSMTPETDESDLLGNYVLINGNMEWRDGPVTTAARQGAVLCIDEIDYGAQNLSSLQRVLEGKPFMLKKKGELITPAPGFTVFATANTKGKGSDDGRYMFTNVLNEAFLERFRTTMEQEFPPVKTERKIIEKELTSVGRADNEFAEKLVTWADVIRKTFADGGCDEVISTRRLVHIVETFGIFGDKMKSISLCLNRFDDDTKASFLDLYTKVDAGANTETILASTMAPEEVPNPEEDVPF